MAFNKFMHPRNLYRNPPDFAQLARDYPKFAKFVIQKASGGCRVDFKNVDALRALTVTLLKKDFDLDVDLPPNRLVPTLPLRLNYILWLEDLLEVAHLTSNIHGLDIGTGASCIYPLLGAKKNKWKFIGTDVDEDAVKWAQTLVESNNLQEYIEILKVEPGEVLLNLVNERQEDFDFCMCNPPFFQEPFDASEQHKPSVNKESGATKCERVYEGGEEMLVKEIIDDSKILKEKVRIYTSMLGKKAAFLETKNYLHTLQDIQMTTTEFCQGNIKRWGIAWTFIPEIKLNEVKNRKPSKHKNIRHSYVIPYVSEEQYTIPLLKERIESLLQELRIIYEVLITVPYMVTMSVKAFENTWIHQRRKRREMMRQMKAAQQAQVASARDDGMQEGKCDPEMPGKSENGKTCASDEGRGVKRKADEVEQEEAKKLKLDLSESGNHLEDNAEKPLVLSCKLSLVKVESSIHLTLYDCDVSVDANPMCQLMQFFKNKLK